MNKYSRRASYQMRYWKTRALKELQKEKSTMLPCPGPGWKLVVRRLLRTSAKTYHVGSELPVGELAGMANARALFSKQAGVPFLEWCQAGTPTNGRIIDHPPPAPPPKPVEIGPIPDGTDPYDRWSKWCEQTMRENGIGEKQARDLLQIHAPSFYTDAQRAGCGAAQQKCGSYSGKCSPDQVRFL
jgi:hypothetical protein